MAVTFLPLWLYVALHPLVIFWSPGKVKVKVDGKRHRTPYRTGFDEGAALKLVAPRVFVKHGVHYVFKKWKGVHGKAKHKRKLRLTVGVTPISLKATYRPARRR